MADASPSLGDLAREGATYLKAKNVPSPRIDAEVLLALALGITRSALLGKLREAPPAEIEAEYRALLRRRGDRVPLQHLTGRQEFWSLEFVVDGRVLIPRPETELIVEEVLARNSTAEPWIADVGTGSGNIAVALARQIPSSRILATDISAGALEVARTNAVRHGVAGRIHFLQGNLTEPLEREVGRGRLDFLVSNPPYVSEAELEGLEPEVRDHDPRLALSPGPDPFRCYPSLVAAAPRLLKSGGHLVLELPAGGADPVETLVRKEPSLEFLTVRADYSGLPRTLVARRR